MDRPIDIIPHSRPTLGEEEVAAVARVVKSGQLTQGEKVAKFESQMASRTGRRHAVAVSSGLAALHLSLIGLDVGQGNDVIVPSYTCDALLDAIYFVGATPAIVDVRYSDGNLTKKDVEGAINDRTRAIMVPHSFGFPAEVDEIADLGIPVIEDCAGALGGYYRERKLGTFGAISICSFYATKIITTGEGGMLLTDDHRIAENVSDLRNYTGHEIFRVRYNYKMTDFAAALGLVQLEKLDAFLDKRRKLVDRYNELLAGLDDMVLPFWEPYASPAFWRYVPKILFAEAQEIRMRMKERNVQCGRGVLQPLHRLLGLPPVEYPNTERLVQEGLSLPLYPTLEEAEVDYVANSLIRCVRGGE